MTFQSLYIFILLSLTIGMLFICLISSINTYKNQVGLFCCLILFIITYLPLKMVFNRLFSYLSENNTLSTSVLLLVMFTTIIINISLIIGIILTNLRKNKMLTFKQMLVCVILTLLTVFLSIHCHGIISELSILLFPLVTVIYGLFGLEFLHLDLHPVHIYPVKASESSNMLMDRPGTSGNGNGNDNTNTGSRRGNNAGSRRGTNAGSRWSPYPIPGSSRNPNPIAGGIRELHPGAILPIPNVSGNVNPIPGNISANVNPYVNPSANPGVNPSVNSGVNPYVNPSINPSVNSGVSSSVNPSVDPSVNTSVNPRGRRYPSVPPINPNPDPNVYPYPYTSVNSNALQGANTNASNTSSPSPEGWEGPIKIDPNNVQRSRVYLPQYPGEWIETVHFKESIPLNQLVVHIGDIKEQMHDSRAHLVDVLRQPESEGKRDLMARGYEWWVHVQRHYDVELERAKRMHPNIFRGHAIEPFHDQFQKERPNINKYLGIE